MNRLNELLKQKFSSGNDVPVTSVRITREEYESAMKDVVGVDRETSYKNGYRDGYNQRDAEVMGALV